ncbi:MAG: HPr family phosphocarrier protein [Sulfuriflexus sp.]|nr:HPr family phosphocarrier protein [Sulfuriflexus sp.]
MTDMDITIVNKLGLHARAAAKFVTLASSFNSDIQISREGRTVNGKSIMGVMMLAAAKGTQLTLHISGQDEEAALNQLNELVNNKFGENE